MSITFYTNYVSSLLQHYFMYSSYDIGTNLLHCIISPMN